MKKISKLLLIGLVSVLLMGCGSSEKQNELENQESVEYIGEFEKADYDKYNSYASENGLGDSKIYIEGTVIEKQVIEDTIHFVLQQKDGNKWVVSVGTTPVWSSEMVDELIGKEIRVFGKYIGFSNNSKMPHIHIMDENFDNPELYVALLDENGDQKEIISFFSDDLGLNMMKELFSYDSNITVAELNGENGKSLLISKYISKNETSDESYKNAEKIGSIISEASREKWFEYELVFFDSWNDEAQRISSVTTNIDDMKISQEYVWHSENGNINSNEEKRENNQVVDPEVENTQKSEEVKTEQQEQKTEEQSSPVDDVTIGKINALKKAQQYLKITAFSYKGLIEQLEYEKFTHEESVYAADNCGADWNEQAAKKAEKYLNLTSFSKEGLIEQLEYDGFTYEQAVYGAQSCGY